MDGTMSDSERDREPAPKASVQVNPQWVTPALLISLIALMAVISFNLLTELREVRAEIKGDLGSMRTEFKADNRDMKGDLRADIQAFRAESKEDVQKLHEEIKDNFQEFRTALKDAIGEVKSDNRELGNHVDALAQASETDLKDSLMPINSRIDQIYQLQIPKTQ